MITGDAVLYDKITEYYKKCRNYEQILALLDWDQAVYMPQSGVESRSDAVKTISEEFYKMLTDDKFCELLNECILKSEFTNYTDKMKNEIHSIKKRVDNEKKVPVSLQSNLSGKTSLAMMKWEYAKKNQNDKEYLEILDEIIKLKKEVAFHRGYDNNPYDALLNEYDEGLKVDKISKVFNALRKNIMEIKESGVNTEFIKADYSDNAVYDVEEQKKMLEFFLSELNLKQDELRLDKSVHPFTTTIGYKDVRITTRFDKSDFTNSLFSGVHEAGHALYESNMQKIHGNCILSEIYSLSLHESQSRFYENIVARSLEFWNFYFDKFKSHFPDSGFKNANQIYNYVNSIYNNPIRTESDELNYNLHVMIRFEIENMIFNDKISVYDLEETWNQKTLEYLDFSPQSKSEGYLQDVHWSAGLFGYFPTYTMGNLISGQINYKMKQDIGSFDFSREDMFSRINHWFTDNFYKYNNLTNSMDVVKLSTTEELNAEYFVDYLKKKYE